MNLDELTMGRRSRALRSTNPVQLLALAKKGDLGVKVHLARNPCVTGEVLEYLFNTTLFPNPFTYWERNYGGGDFVMVDYVRSVLAHHELPKRCLKRVLKHHRHRSSTELRRMVAEMSTDPKVLMALLTPEQYPSPLARTILDNPALPVSVLVNYTKMHHWKHAAEAAFLTRPRVQLRAHALESLDA